MLHDLFSWGLDAADKTGKLPDMTAEDIAAALEITGKKGVQTVEALVSAGYLVQDSGGAYAIHDWYEYAGKLMDKREADKERMRRLREARKA